MTATGLILRSLVHYRGLNLGVLAGVALTSAILSGALVVGDSVKESLRRDAAARLAGAGPALSGGERFFTEALAERALARLAEANPDAILAPALQLEGTVTLQGGGRRLNRVQLLGVSDAFWRLSPAGGPPAALAEKPGRWFAVNDAAARRLDAGAGDRLIVRLEKPGALSRDAPLSGESEQTVPLTGQIDAVLGPEHFGRYSLRAEQIPPATVFVPLETLQLAVDLAGRANLLLGGADLPAARLAEAVEAEWSLADAQLHLARAGQGGSLWQLSTSRVFLDPAVAGQALAAAEEVSGAGADVILTYLVNAIRRGEAMAPYSMVAATGSLTNDLVPEGLGPREIILTDWLAEDLGAEPGDELELEYFTVESGRKLREDSARFIARGVAPLDHPQVDQSWTPEFPGVLEVDTMDEWEPGIPIDNDRIRQKDDDYWQEHRATPKAFVSLEAGRELWANRFGEATSLRFPAAGVTEEAYAAALKSRLSAGDLGWATRDLRAEAVAAVDQSFDFGQLFASMSFFLIAAALALTGLVFVFGIEQRAGQIGLLMALGFGAGRTRRLFLAEAAALAAAGAALGLAGGWIYTRLALLGMSGAWQAAASGIEFTYSLRAGSLATAFAVTVALALAVVWFASRLVTRVQPSHLIAGGPALAAPARSGKAGRGRRVDLARWTAGAALLGGAGCLLAPKTPGTMAEQGLFFGAGFLFTVAGISACALGLRRLERPGAALSSLAALGRQNSVRRKGRSLAVIGLMAAGVFMVTAINSFRLEGERGAERRGSGTGGFAYIGESTLPVYEDLNSAQGREKYGLDPAGEWRLLQFRASDGEDASCLNLNRAQRPRLLAVAADQIAALDPFTFSRAAAPPGDSPWTLLAESEEAGAGEMLVIPGVIDMNTATYALKIGLGDLIEYETPGGERFGVRVAGLLETSVLQGSVIIAEEAFIRQFPDAGGYRQFLLDAAPGEAAGEVAAQLTRMLGDRGLEMLPAWERLNEFNAVQNTYLSIFSTLGGLGLLLGTVGLAVVVGRNVLERRGQLGLMQAVGFTRRRLARMILDEHWFLHVLGVLIGALAALVAVLPKLLSQSSGFPAALLLGVNGAILAGGLVFCAAAARLVLRGPLVEALRSE